MQRLNQSSTQYIIISSSPRFVGIKPTSIKRIPNYIDEHLPRPEDFLYISSALLGLSQDNTLVRWSFPHTHGELVLLSSALLGLSQDNTL